MALRKSPFSLIDSLNEKAYSASIVATFNAYLPFYEQVVLRRLLAAGCSYNIVLMDAVQCAASFARDELRPRLAGTDYMLVPISVPGAFHPKVFLRLGPKKGSLFIGSHNLTVAGFGFNDELTNLFSHDGDAVPDSDPFNTTIAFLRAHLLEDMPQLREAFDNAIQVAPWLRSPSAVNPTVRVLHMQAAQPDLWSQLRTIVSGRVRRAFVTAPFFDSDLQFVSRLIHELKPTELSVAIDPDCVEIPARKAAKLQNVRWLDLSKRTPNPHSRAGLLPYLHAKAYWFETDQAEVLVTGSANASHPAFTAPDAKRNAEVVVARIAKPGRSLANEIGVTALLRLPEVTESVWDQIAERQTRIERTRDRDKASCGLAVVTSSGFLLDRPVDRDATITALGLSGQSLGSVSIARAAPKAELTASDDCRDSAQVLSISVSGVVHFAIVHHPSRIAELHASDIRRALRHTLGSVDDDPSQLESLLKLTEKVIFDSELEISPSARAPGKKGHSQKTELDAASPESLAVEAKGRRRSAGKRRSLASGDITVLLDALIKRLGEGLIEPQVPSGPTEDEKIDSDDEAEELPPPPVDLERLGSLCRRKARRLLSRMEDRLALGKDEPCRAIVQLAAVMSVLHRLRIIEQRDDWRRARVRLLDTDDLAYFFQAASEVVGCGTQSLGTRALEITDNEAFEELSIAVGLLVWLGWTCEPQPEPDPERPWTKGVVDEEEFLRWKQQLLYLGELTVDDGRAQLIATDALEKTPRRAMDHLTWWGNTITDLGWIASLERDPSSIKSSKNPIEPGDFVLLPPKFDPRVRLAQSVDSGTSGPMVSVIDAEKEEGVRKFVASFVKNIDRESRAESSGVA